jgi:hypothetical protein
MSRVPASRLSRRDAVTLNGARSLVIAALSARTGADLSHSDGYRPGPMGRPRARIACLLTTAFLALPASAFAQSAGDEQYQDPFGGDDQQQSSGDQGSSSGSDSSSGSAGTTTAQAAPTAAPVAAAAQASTPAAPQLPRTGGDPIMPAVAGFWLLLGGVALRARLRLDDRRA